MANEKKISQILEKRLSGKQLSELESNTLIHASIVPEIADDIIQVAAKIERPHKDNIFLLPPLYISDFCINKCLYCNFRNNGEALTLDEFVNEFQSLMKKGYRSIELVFSQDPKLFRKENISKVVEYFKIARELLGNDGMLTINAPPVTKEQYEELKQSGVDTMLLWAETFNPMQYEILHPGNTPKSDQRFRLNAYKRAKKAGIKYLAGTFLKDLYDWRTEETMLCYLDRRISGFSIIGTPRYKEEEEKPFQKYPMQDKEYILNIALNLLIYKGAIWLQTRESWELNKQIIDTFGGGFIFTTDCSTAVGGYAKKPKGKEQFPVDRYETERIQRELKGINLIYNWGTRELEQMRRC